MESAPSDTQNDPLGMPHSTPARRCTSDNSMRCRVSLCSMPSDTRLNAPTRMPVPLKTSTRPVWLALPINPNSSSSRRHNALINTSLPKAPVKAQGPSPRGRVLNRLDHPTCPPMPPSKGWASSMSCKNSRVRNPPCWAVCRKPELKALVRWLAHTSNEAPPRSAGGVRSATRSCAEAVRTPKDAAQKRMCWSAFIRLRSIGFLPSGLATAQIHAL